MAKKRESEGKPRKNESKIKVKVFMPPKKKQAKLGISEGRWHCGRRGLVWIYWGRREGLLRIGD